MSADAAPNPSFSRLSDREIEAGSIGEGPEVLVARKKRDAAVDTALGDQGIAEAGFTALRQHLGS